MTEFRQYIAEQIIGQRLHFKCDCILALDTEGIVRGVTVKKDEMVFDVDVDGKIIQIGSNHPNLYVTPL